jgi:RNA polymerase sigma-B factor
MRADTRGMRQDEDTPVRAPTAPMGRGRRAPYHSRQKMPTATALPQRRVPPARRRTSDGRPDERALFARHRREPDPELREALVERFLPLARQLALRYDAPGNAYEDVFQVACLALVKAVDRFEPDRGVAFSSYAVPTVLGEIKRWFRDQTWAVHVTRDLQERCLRVSRTVDDLAARLGRPPTVTEVAEAAGCAEEEVLEALEVACAHRAASLDAPQRAEDEGDVALAETIGGEDERLATAERRADLAVLVGRLGPRERRALQLRFECDLTQAEIAGVLGVSQMQVSRILRRALERLRRLDGVEPPPNAS